MKDEVWGRGKRKGEEKIEGEETRQRQNSC